MAPFILIGLLSFFSNSIFEIFLGPDVPPAKVHTGQAVPWRTLLDFKPELTNYWEDSFYGTYPCLRAVDLDNDGNQEVLVRLPKHGRTPAGWREYTVAGQSRPLDFKFEGDIEVIREWDWDHDGDDELLVKVWIPEFTPRGEKYQRGETRNLVADLDGTELADLGPKVRYEPTRLADLNGDGRIRLIDFNDDDYCMYAHDSNGSERLFPRHDGGPYSYCLDFDGDGRAELAESSTGFTDEFIDVYGIGEAGATEKQRFQSILIDDMLFASDLTCLDANRDGIDEIVVYNLGYYDPAADTTVIFNWPNVHHSDFSVTPDDCMAALFDIDGDGELEYIICSCTADTIGKFDTTAICAFDRSGALVYYEEFGQGCECLISVNSDGTDYLVVALATKVVIYP